MFGLSKIWSALASLAANLNALSTTVAEVNAGLRQQCRLDGPVEQLEPPVVEQEAIPEPARNGRGRKTVSA